MRRQYSRTSVERVVSVVELCARRVWPVVEMVLASAGWRYSDSVGGVWEGGARWESQQAMSHFACQHVVAWRGRWWRRRGAVV